MVLNLCFDDDGDGACNAADLCADTIPGAGVDEEGCPSPAIPADLDFDGDVDLTDHGTLASCVAGPGIMEPACVDADLDLDGDVDLFDFSLFQDCFSGKNVLVNPSCGN